MIDSFDPETGDIQATVIMYSRTERLENDDIHFLLLEDNLSGESTRATRTIIDNVVSLAGRGNRVTFNESFTIDPEWNPEEFHAVVFVQKPDKEIIQAASNLPPNDYNLRAMVPFERTQIGDSSTNIVGEEIALLNVGNPADYSISLIVDSATSGWTVSYSIGEEADRSDTTNISLAKQESVDLRCTVTSTSPGFMRYHIEVSGTRLSQPLVIPFSYLTNDVDVLIVDDDGGEDYETYFAEALGSQGKTFNVWDRNEGALTSEIAESFPLLVWNVGNAYPTLDSEDRDFLEAYLDAGNSLFLSGQDIGWDLNRSDDNKDPFFMWNYLHSIFVADDIDDKDLVGVTHDPISDGLNLHIEGGDGANNQTTPDVLKVYGPHSTDLFRWSTDDWAAAIRSHNIDTGACLVFLSFGFEGIDNAADRATFMENSIEWLKLCHTNPLGQPGPRQPGGRN